MTVTLDLIKLAERSDFKTHEEFVKLVDLTKQHLLSQNLTENNVSRGVALFIALKNSLMRCVSFLLLNGCSVRDIVVDDADVQVSVIASALFEAYEGDFALLERINEAGVPVDVEIDELGRTPLMAATWHSLEVCRWCLTRGASLNAVDHYLDTPLSYSCMTDSTFVIDDEVVAIVSLLVDSGGKINATNCSGNGPLQILLSQQAIGELTLRVQDVLKRGIK